ncbi:hypothetical protein PT974_11149 [Cladobotryum mycophilum]|uniref:Uncharacterized protein n=1 Tax=Cladobotryum mycophilum TaxID=491253 RepID=A0ABR0S4E4_9HYPO
MKHEHIDFGSLSLNQIDRLYPRQRLFVRPPLWTSRQLELLSCCFQDVDSSDASIETSLPTPSPSSGGLSDSEKQLEEVPEKTLAQKWDSPLRRAKDLCRPPNAPCAHATFRCLVAHDDSLFTKAGDNIAFRFDGRRVDRLTCSLFALRSAVGVGSKTTPEPRFAYLNYADVQTHRIKEHRVRRWHPYMNNNPQVSRLYGKKLARLEPKEWTEDPYIAAVLIAVAQAQQRRSTSNSGPSDSALLDGQLNYKSILIVTRVTDQEAIHLYSAKISSNFLKRFDKPSFDPAVPTGLMIEHWTLPFQPFETLQQRLRVEMTLHCPGRGIDQIPASIQTRLAIRKTFASGTPCSTLQKRKRETEDVCDNKLKKMPSANLGTMESIGASA